MRVLGVDPGLTRCGLGVIDSTPAGGLRLVAVDVVCTPGGGPVGERLLTVEAALEAWLTDHQPDAVAVERVFSQHNVRTVMGTAQASGIAVLAATRRGLPLSTYTPTEVKAAVTGNGRAPKSQVAGMVTRLLQLQSRPTPPDASDALALAICDVWRGSARNRLSAAASGRGGSR
ncbi:MAG: crossover junction endodeoxyribonuclease RuvC [Jiangellaceae bacterium]|nr:crossover junction endodeoxyribonuclease RuvC [Jiangellaceae bacterium]